MDFLDCENSNAKQQIENSLIENIFTTKRPSNLALMADLKSVGLMKFDFEYQESNKIKRFLWNLRTIRIAMQRK